MIDRLSVHQTVLDELRHNPGVALLGPRQCGKTTLARRIAAEAGARVFDLENPADLAALEQPMLALADLRGLVVLDEVQRKPELFPALRVLMDRPDLPARFLLLGSASPQLVKGVTESLAGRIAFVDLQGFTLDEVGAAARDTLWWRGGFPRAFLAASDARSDAWRRDFIRTVIDRDFATLGLGATPRDLGRLWQMTAHYHGQTLNASEIARSLGNSYQTVRRHLDLLEGAFLVRRLQPWFANVGKRLVKSPKLYIRDAGLLHALLGISTPEELRAHPKLGASWEGFALEQLLSAMPRVAPWFWGTQAGAELDLYVETRGKRVGFEFKYADAPSFTRSMHAALDDLELDALHVVTPAGPSYRLAESVHVGSIEDTLTICRERYRVVD